MYLNSFVSITAEAVRSSLEDFKFTSEAESYQFQGCFVMYSWIKALSGHPLKEAP